MFGVEVTTITVSSLSSSSYSVAVAVATTADVVEAYSAETMVAQQLLSFFSFAVAAVMVLASSVALDTTLAVIVVATMVVTAAVARETTTVAVDANC